MAPQVASTPILLIDYQEFLSRRLSRKLRHNTWHTQTCKFTDYMHSLNISKWYSVVSITTNIIYSAILLEWFEYVGAHWGCMVRDISWANYIGNHGHTSQNPLNPFCMTCTCGCSASSPRAFRRSWILQCVRVYEATAESLRECDSESTKMNSLQTLSSSENVHLLKLRHIINAV